MIECHFYPFFEKKMTWVIISSGIQSIVNDVFLFLRYLFYLMMMRFCFVFLFFNDVLYFNDAFYLKALLFYPFIPPFPSFPITLIHSFQTLNFLSNSKISFTFQKL